MNCAGWFVEGDYPGNIKFQNHPKPVLCTNKPCMEKKAELLMAFISRPSKALFVDWISVQVYLFVIHTNHSFASRITTTVGGHLSERIGTGGHSDN